MSEAELTREDDGARARATDPAASVLLEAPAGAGKTAVLTQRFLRLLCTVEDPGHILAITFTRKAAAEMQGRVLRALKGDLPGEDAGTRILRPLAQAALAHAQARGWRLLDEPQSLRIQTIDAFNYWLARQLPVAAGAGAALEVTEHAQGMYARAARATLILGEADPELEADVQLLFERFDNHWGSLERMLTAMLARRAHWLPYVLHQSPAELGARISASLHAITQARLTRSLALLPQGLRAQAQRLPGMGVLESTPGSLSHWKRLAFLTQSGSGGWRKLVGPGLLGEEFTDKPARAALKDLIALLAGITGAEAELAQLRDWPEVTVNADDTRALAALSAVLSRAAAELELEFTRSGRIDYTYVAGAARQALTQAGEPTDLALRTGLSLRHILVDEFQDTSIAQAQLLGKLTTGWEPGDGRSLFVVGDPMQSIYRFREAEVGLFLAARTCGIGAVRLEPLSLHRNFRSVPALVDFNNRIFAAVFPARDDLREGAVAYSASVAARTGAADPACVPVTLRLFPQDPAAEAQAIAERIAQLKSADPAARIAILVAAHAHAAPVTAALAMRGIDCLGVDLTPLADRMVVRDLVALTCALHDLGDRTAWLSVLRAPWCGAQLATLAALSGPRETLLVLDAMAAPAQRARCLPADLARLDHLREVLGPSLARRGLEPVADWLESTWVRLGGVDAYAVDELADARVFFTALAERSASGEWNGPEDFPALLAGLSSPGAVTDANPVQVMTIHRAKGLEFEHVFVPALDKGPGAGERLLLRLLDLPNEAGGSDLLIAPAPATGTQKGEELDHFIKDILSTRSAHERTRLMYVAATRARTTLWLSGAPRPAADGTLKPRANSLLRCLWPALAAEFVVEAAAPAVNVAPPAIDPRVALRRLRMPWAAPQLPGPPGLPRLPPGSLKLEPPEFSWVGETQRHVGTVVHAWLARAAAAAKLPDAAFFGQQRLQILAQLRRAGVPQPDLERAGAQVIEALGKTVGDERGRWILDSAHREARAELALTGVSQGSLRTIVIDRTFIDEAGTRWVIDYKTSRHEGGGLEAFLDEEMQRYRAQLAGYLTLAAQLGTEPVRAGLYFPLLGAFRELPQES